MSDHNTLVLKLEVADFNSKLRSWTFERTLLSNDDYCEHVRQWIPLFLGDNLESTSIEMVWDAMKAGIRGETLRFSLNYSKRARQIIKDLQDILVAAEEGLVAAAQERGDLEVGQWWVAAAKSAIFEVLVNRAMDKLTAQREVAYELNEQIGYQLAIWTRQQILFILIQEIKDPVLGRIIDPDQILYMEGSGIEQSYIRDYLDSVPYVQFVTEEQEKFDNPLQCAEILLSINGLARGKATGTECIPTEFYQIFASQ